MWAVLMRTSRENRHIGSIFRFRTSNALDVVWRKSAIYSQSFPDSCREVALGHFIQSNFDSESPNDPYRTKCVPYESMTSVWASVQPRNCDSDRQPRHARAPRAGQQQGQDRYPKAINPSFAAPHRSKTAQTWWAPWPLRRSNVVHKLRRHRTWPVASRD